MFVQLLGSVSNTSNPVSYFSDVMSIDAKLELESSRTQPIRTVTSLCACSSKVNFFIQLELFHQTKIVSSNLTCSSELFDVMTG